MKKNQFVIVFNSKIPRWRDCPECHSKLTCEMGTYSYAPRCRKCRDKKLKEERIETPKTKPSLFVGRGFKDITAIGIDKTTGRQVGVTSKGEHIPIELTRYNTRTDAHGWRAIGKKVREFDSKGRPNI